MAEAAETADLASNRMLTPAFAPELAVRLGELKLD